MSAGRYKIRSLTLAKGKATHVDLDLEFEDGRAFVVWDSISLGNFRLKARLEINPLLLRKDTGAPGSDFHYRGVLVLPRPENN